MTAVSWDPGRYLRYAGERERPFADLLARVAAVEPRRVVDLGCGPGTLTRTLLDRWPRATIEGVDSSAEMVDAARVHAAAGRLTFTVGDLRHWESDEPVDVLVSNATLQWVPGHLDLLERLAGQVTAGGWLAFQVPGNFAAPAHALLDELRRSARWAAAVGPGRVAEAEVAEPRDYLERLVALGARVDAWETTYLHLLSGEDAVLRWMEGTALRPVLSVLTPGDHADFLAEYGALVSAAYPPGPAGTVLPYRRIFVVAQVG